MAYEKRENWVEERLQEIIDHDLECHLLLCDYINALEKIGLTEGEINRIYGIFQSDEFYDPVDGPELWDCIDNVELLQKHLKERK